MMARAEDEMFMSNEGTILNSKAGLTAVGWIDETVQMRLCVSICIFMNGTEDSCCGFEFQASYWPWSHGSGTEADFNSRHLDGCGSAPELKVFERSQYYRNYHLYLVGAHVRTCSAPVRNLRVSPSRNPLQ